MNNNVGLTFCLKSFPKKKKTFCLKSLAQSLCFLNKYTHLCFLRNREWLEKIEPTKTTCRTYLFKLKRLSYNRFQRIRVFKFNTFQRKIKECWVDSIPDYMMNYFKSITPSISLFLFSIPFWDVPKYCPISKNKSH